MIVLLFIDESQGGGTFAKEVEVMVGWLIGWLILLIGSLVVLLVGWSFFSLSLTL